MSKSDVSKKVLYSIKDHGQEMLSKQLDSSVQIEELELKCFALNQKVLELKNIAVLYEKEIAHLKELLKGASVLNIVMPVSDEEEIASIQLEKIKQLSRERALTLPEVKVYDLLVKNKRLSQGEVTNIEGTKILPKEIDKKGLIALAAPAVKVKKNGSNKS